VWIWTSDGKVGGQPGVYVNLNNLETIEVVPAPGPSEGQTWLVIGVPCDGEQIILGGGFGDADTADIFVKKLLDQKLDRRQI
jgi:hypothetical protein